MSIRLRKCIGKEGRGDMERYFGFYRALFRVACCDMPIRRDPDLQRRRTRLTVVASALLCLGFFIMTPIAAGKKQVANMLYETALEQVGRVTAKESLEAFRQVLMADRGHAPAHYEVAKLYMSLDTPMDRQSAWKAVKNAVRLDRDNMTYRLMKGDVLWAQGSWHNAVNEYKKVLEVDPKNAKAAYMIGHYGIKNFMKYDNMVMMNMVSGFNWREHARNRHSWSGFGIEELNEAVSYLKTCIEADPHFKDAYFQLGLACLETNRPTELIRVANLLLERVPDDKDALLFCGLGYQAMGEEVLAHEFYTRALQRMAPDERAVMESVENIVQDEDRAKLVGLPSEQKAGGDVTQPWVDSVERIRFWRRQDPLFLTEFNERRMEHYGRIAYANLRFSRPSKGIEGWRTDMGKAYIKLGRYLDRRMRRPTISTIPIDKPSTFGRSLPGRRIPWKLTMQKETWFYEGFRVDFQLSDGFHGFSPSRLPDRPRYVDPYGRKKYSVPYQVASFKDGDSLRVELAYALPKYNVTVSDSDRSIALENGVFLFDEHWDEAYRKTSDLKLRWPEITPSGYPAVDSLRNSHLVFQLAFRLAPGAYHLVGEVRDRNQGSIGTFWQHREFAAVDSSLWMSDLLLAARIETRTPYPAGRSDLDIVANPLRTYHRSEPAFIYLEVYNLERDEFGRTEYEIAYRIGRPEQKKIDPYLFVAQRLPEGGNQLEVTRVFRTRETGIRRPLRAADEEEQPHQGLPVAPPVVVQDYFDAHKKDELTYRARFVFPDEEKLASRIKKLGRSKEGVETTITARYEGDREDDFTYLQIDLSHVPVGVHRLSVRVRDVHNDQVVSRHALFRVIE